MKLTLLFGILLIAGFFFLGFQHELVHQQIFEYYDINSRVSLFEEFPHFATISEANCPTEECILAHSINEAISYPLMAFYFVIGIALLVIIGLLEIQLNKKPLRQRIDEKAIKKYMNRSE